MRVCRFVFDHCCALCMLQRSIISAKDTQKAITINIFQTN